MELSRPSAIWGAAWGEQVHGWGRIGGRQPRVKLAHLRARGNLAAAWDPPRRVRQLGGILRTFSSPNGSNTTAKWDPSPTSTSPPDVQRSSYSFTHPKCQARCRADQRDMWSPRPSPCWGR